MLLDVIRSVDHAAQPLAQVLLEQPCDQFAHINGDLGREVKETYCDAPIDFVRVLIVERRVARQHLEDENTKGPPVHSVIMADRHDYFRGQILWRPAKRECLIVDLLREAKISDLHVTIGGNQQILRFQVAISDLLLVEIFERQYYFSDIEQGNIVGEEVLSSQ